MTTKRKRQRATVIAEKDGKVLLIREKGQRQYSLPGGGIERGEYTMEAALRELREETKLRPSKAERLFDHEGTTQIYKVVRVQVRGNIELQRKEVSDYKWWDGKEPLPMLPSTEAILRKVTTLALPRKGHTPTETGKPPLKGQTISFNGHVSGI